jgi:hypothetical protein
LKNDQRLRRYYYYGDSRYSVSIGQLIVVVPVDEAIEILPGFYYGELYDANPPTSQRNQPTFPYVQLPHHKLGAAKPHYLKARLRGFLSATLVLIGGH